MWRATYKFTYLLITIYILATDALFRYCRTYIEYIYCTYINYRLNRSMYIWVAQYKSSELCYWYAMLFDKHFSRVRTIILLFFTSDERRSFSKFLATAAATIFVRYTARLLFGFIITYKTRRIKARIADRRSNATLWCIKQQSEVVTSEATEWVRRLSARWASGILSPQEES